MNITSYICCILAAISISVIVGIIVRAIFFISSDETRNPLLDHDYKSPLQDFLEQKERRTNSLLSDINSSLKKQDDDILDNLKRPIQRPPLKKQ